MSSQEHPRIALKFVATPGTQHFVSAPPVLSASSHTVDYTYGTCEAALMHAVHNLSIRCTGCGVFNATDQ